ncbi:MAG: hypothetical protein HY753_05715, partial [Nitrospirae bacterium]|nr:hypothetical protein [Nitrospirota bacterium]
SSPIGASVYDHNNIFLGKTGINGLELNNLQQGTYKFTLIYSDYITAEIEGDAVNSKITHTDAMLKPTISYVLKDIISTKNKADFKIVTGSKASEGEMSVATELAEKLGINKNNVITDDKVNIADISKDSLIVIGNPCVSSVSGYLLGMPWANNAPNIGCAEDFFEQNGVVMLFNDRLANKYYLVIAGLNAEDTQMSVRAVSNAITASDFSQYVSRRVEVCGTINEIRYTYTGNDFWKKLSNCHPTLPNEKLTAALIMQDIGPNYEEYSKKTGNILQSRVFFKQKKCMSQKQHLIHFRNMIRLLSQELIQKYLRTCLINYLKRELE